MAFDIEKLNARAAGVMSMHEEDFTFNSATYKGSPTVLSAERLVTTYGHDATLSGSFFMKKDNVDFEPDELSKKQVAVTWRGATHRFIGYQWDATQSSLRVDLTQDEG
jgi:hypothetical protein